GPRGARQIWRQGGAASTAGSLSGRERGGVRGYKLSTGPTPLTPTLSPAGRGSPAMPWWESVLIPHAEEDGAYAGHERAGIDEGALVPGRVGVRLLCRRGTADRAADSVRFDQSLHRAAAVGGRAGVPARHHRRARALAF